VAPMTHRPVDPMADLERALDVSPSPDFAARVRTRVDAVGAQAGWTGMRWTMACAVAVAVVGMVGVPGWKTATYRAATTSATAVSAPPAAPTSTAEPVPVNPPVPTLRLSRPTPGAGSPPESVVAAMPVPSVPSPAPVVRVSPGEARALDRFIAAANSGLLVVPQFGAPIDEVTGELLPLVALDSSAVDVAAVSFIRRFDKHDAADRRNQP